jgi:hypothetical protein
VNGKPVRCGDAAQTLPFPVNGLLYFELTGDDQAMATNIWWQGSCKPGPYPPWPGSTGGTVGPADASTD